MALWFVRAIIIPLQKSNLALCFEALITKRVHTIEVLILGIKSVVL